MARHNRSPRRLLRIDRGDDGFSMVEAMVAVTILLVAILLSMQPLMSAMLRIADARALTVAENLAQAEIESVRSLEYGDVGSEGYTPDGVLPRTREVELDGARYRIDVVVTYEGSITGLSIVDQGGDGVQGTFDPGVDYKFVQVTVTPLGNTGSPVTMETLVAPGSLGAHEGIANLRVTLARYEPFETSDLVLPSLAIQDPPAAEIRSGVHTEQQVFPAVPVGEYTVSLDQANGWVIHPDDTAAGLQQVEAVAGLLKETNFRVYKSSRMVATITDADTGLTVPDARISLVHVPSGDQTDYAPGVTLIEGLMPDAYDITVSASGYYEYEETSTNVPAGYPDDLDHQLIVELEPIPPPPTTTTTTSTTTTTIPSTTTTTEGGSTTTTTAGTTTTTTEPPTTTTTTTPVQQVTVRFTVRDNTNRRINGATVTVEHPTRGTLTAVSDQYGYAYMDLEPGTDFTAEATTEWGHGPVDRTFDPGDDTTISLTMTRPWGRGTYVMRNGERAHFAVSDNGGWAMIPPNYQHEASFVAPSGWRQVAKVCDADGSVASWTWVYVRAGQNRSVTLGGWCP